MKQHVFEHQGEEIWQRFEQNLAEVEQGYRLKKGSDTKTFVRDYQKIARDLSVAQSRGYSRQLVQRLNHLVIGGHNVIYVYRSGFLTSSLNYIRHDFPARVRQEWRYMAVAALLFLVPLFGIAIGISNQPEYVYSVMPASQVSEFEAMYDPAAKALGRERQSDTDLAMFGHYIWNNISIAFRVYAGGLTFGLLTIFSLVFNGLSIGAVAGHLLSIGYGETFLSFVAGHGSFELTALVFAGGAGLILAHALIAPGHRNRWGALRVAGRTSIEVLIGSAVMLFIAAFIEAFWSSSSTVPVFVKYLVGVFLWLLVGAYFVFAGRTSGVVRSGPGAQNTATDTQAISSDNAN